MRGGELLLGGALIRVRLLLALARLLSELREVLSEPRDVVCLLGEERLELALLVVLALAQDRELLFRVL